jgi:DNA-binding response OmpR family regulator
MSAPGLLLIEDDQLLRELYAQALEQAGFAVLAAPDAQTGLDLLDEYGASAVILDLLMPFHDGVEVLYELQSHPDWQNLPVIVLSALNRQRIPAGLGELGVTRYLDKSEAGPAELVAAVRHIL